MILGYSYAVKPHTNTPNPKKSGAWGGVMHVTRTK